MKVASVAVASDGVVFGLSLVKGPALEVLESGVEMVPSGEPLTFCSHCAFSQYGEISHEGLTSLLFSSMELHRK